MIIPFSKELKEKLKKDDSEKEVYSYISKQGLFETVVRYIIDSKYRRGVHLKNWCKNQLNNKELKKIVEEQGFKKESNMDRRMIKILNYWKNFGKGGLIYQGDKKIYGSNEYWATIEEILEVKRDDCDGFGNIIYHTAILSDIPVYRLFIVAGDVKGGGHCYCLYLADDGLFYPIDGCYWVSKSLRMRIPYTMRYEYYSGDKEWFRFNHEGMYKSTN